MILKLNSFDLDIKLSLNNNLSMDHKLKGCKGSKNSDIFISKNCYNNSEVQNVKKLTAFATWFCVR